VQIDFLGVQAFLAVAECGSFAQAAERLSLSQTAVSHRMRKFEESLGVLLLVRTARGVVLTEAGVALLPRARAAVQQLESSFDLAHQIGRSAGSTVAFGCLPTIAAGILVPLLQRHEREQPQVQIRVFDSSPAEILQLVESATAAFGITVQRGSNPRLDSERIAEEAFVLVCPQSHAWAARASMSWAQLSDQPLIRIGLPSGNSMTIDEAVGPLREQLLWRYEAQRTVAALDMVRARLGLTIVPELSVGAGDDLAVIPLESPRVTRTLAVVRRRDEKLLPAAKWLCEQAVELLRQRLRRG
jgi:DNA-binding transcriptional LysR family regulator